jgi:pyruvate/2-oxoglutarate dehydrogenase complex dihydrolipoamide dehydrogenase (E3) component
MPEAHNIASPDSTRKIDYTLLMTVVFAEPQVAVVELTEKIAIAQKIHFLTASHLFSDHGKSLIMDAVVGFVKLLADSQPGEIPGGELIHEIVAAMAKNMTVHELAAMPHYHPTLAEIWTYPAEELASQISPSRWPQ